MPTKNTHQKKALVKVHKRQLVITMLAIVVVVIGALYWMVKVGENNNAIRLQAVNKRSIYTNGVITSIFHYKGRTLRVKYTVNGKAYEYSGGWDNNPRQLGVDDTIKIRYAVDNPSLVITELEDEF